MILVDTNILIYAEDGLSPLHEEAQRWWDTQLSGESPLCMCWSVLTTFIRVSTNRQIFDKPLTLKQAITRVQSWLEQPCVRLIDPTESHWQIFQNMLLEGQAQANLVVDAHLANTCGRTRMYTVLDGFGFQPLSPAKMEKSSQATKNHPITSLYN